MTEEKRGFFHNLLSKILGKKEEQDQQVPKEEVATKQEEVATSSIPEGSEKCEVCGLAIYGEQRVVHKFGNAYHLKPCWRSKMKEAKQAMVGN